MTYGNKVRARKRQAAAGIGSGNTFNSPQSNHPNHSKNDRLLNNFLQGHKPDTPETFERPVLRKMLRDKARHDIQQQYGRQGNHSGTVVYMEFPKRNRRRVEKRLASRWFDQIRENLAKGGETTRQRGVIRGLIHKLWGGKENTLAASGIGR